MFTGIVEELGAIISIDKTLAGTRMEILRHCIVKGSITVDGISLTINQVTDRGFSISIIPHTAKVTTLGHKQVGDAVNLESDLIGKYVERLLQERGQIPAKPVPVIDK